MRRPIPPPPVIPLKIDASILLKPTLLTTCRGGSRTARSFKPSLCSSPYVASPHTFLILAHAGTHPPFLTFTRNPRTLPLSSRMRGPIPPPPVIPLKIDASILLKPTLLTTCRGGSRTARSFKPSLCSSPYVASPYPSLILAYAGTHLRPHSRCSREGGNPSFPPVASSPIERPSWVPSSHPTRTRNPRTHSLSSRMREPIPRSSPSPVILAPLVCPRVCGDPSLLLPSFL